MTGERDPLPRAGDLVALARRRAPVVSLRVPVTARVPGVSQNAVRHGRVVEQARERLEKWEGDAAIRERALRELSGFAEESEAPAPEVAARVAFWSPDEGLVRFGLPFADGEEARLAHSARLRPVALAAQRAGRYRVLVLSVNHVALFEGDERGLSRAAASRLPGSLEDALGRELSDPSLQLHSGGGSGGRPVYHGQGGSSRERRIDLERFHRAVARALEAEVADDRVPLVLAAESRHRPGLEAALHRDVGLVGETLEGNADHLSASALHEAAWPLARDDRVDPRAERERAREGPEPLVEQISDIALQATMGRIRRLWVPSEGSIPGRLDLQEGRAAEAWADDDLLDDLAAEVLRRGGTVYVVEGETHTAGSPGLAAQLW